MSEPRPNIYPGESMTPREAIRSSEKHYTKYKELYETATEADDKADTLARQRVDHLQGYYWEKGNDEEAQAQIDSRITRELADNAFKAYATKAELNHNVVNYIPDVVSENRAAFHDAAVAEARLDGVTIKEESK